MSLIRTVHNRENPYVQLNKKALWDPDLSLEAVGLWARLLSRPDDWQVSVIELSKSCKCGKDKIYRLLNELIKAGYAYRYQSRVDTEKKKNVFGTYGTYVFEFKVSKEEIQKMFPVRGFSLAGMPVTGNTDTTNNRLTNSSSIPSEEEQKKSKRPTSSVVSADAEYVCDLFLKKIRERYSDFKEPNLKKWLKEIDLLLRVDKRTVDQAKQLIEWASTDGWWKSACLSPTKLRKCWDEMWIQMQSRIEKALIQKNRTCALALKEKYPDKLKGFTFDDKYAINREAGKEIPFNLPHETFKAALVSMFGGSYDVAR